MELETSENLEQELNEKIEALQSQLEKEREQESVQLKNSEDLHLSLAALEQQNTFIMENISRIDEETERFEAELRELDVNRGNASEEIREKEEKITELRKTIEDSRELFGEINGEIQEQTKKKEELNQKHKDFLRMREELSKHIAALDKECFRLNSQKESYEEASEKQINYMWEEYELTYNRAMELRDPNLTDLAFMKRQIQTLKTDIRKLGTVNVNAIEDFKNVSERYTFLKGQHDDLVEADSLAYFSADVYTDYSGAWISLPQLAGNFGIDYATLMSRVRNSMVEMEDSSGKLNVAYIVDYKAAGDMAPLDYCSARIEDMIISIRKHELISNLERDLLEDARSKGKIEIL